MKPGIISEWDYEEYIDRAYGRGADLRETKLWKPTYDTDSWEPTDSTMSSNPRKRIPTRRGTGCWPRPTGYRVPRE